MPMKDALGELRQGAVDLANKIRPKGIAAGGAAPPAQVPPTPAVSYESWKGPLVTTMDGKPTWNAPSLSVETPAQATARVAGAATPPAEPPAAAPRTGLRSSLGTAARYGGQALGVVGGAATALDAGQDMAKNGANVDNTTNLLGGAALAAGSVASAPVATGAGAFLAGKGIGGRIADTVLSPFVDRSTEQYARGTANIEELNRVAAENPNGRLAQSIRGGNSMGGMLTAPAAAPAVAAPAATDGAATPPSGTQFFAPGSAGARGIRAQINDRSFVPASGTGLVTNNTTGAAVSLDSRQPASGAAPAPLSDRDLVAATLRDQMVNGRNGRSRREAAQRMTDLLSNEATSETARQRLRFDSGKYNAELGDKRIEDFNKQFVNNQFYRSEKDKDGNVRDVPDTAMNAQFLDFMRNTDPRFATPDGMAEINALGSQARNKLIGELRQAFLEKQNVESTLEGSKLMGNVERSNRRISIGGVREAGVGDIPDIGLSGYLWSNLPFTDRNVVETDRGKVLASNFIGKGEGSADRRARIYSKEK